MTTASTIPDAAATGAALLAGLTVELEQLITGVESGRLAELEDAELLGFAQGFERLRNLLPRVDHAIVGACNGSELASRVLRRTTHGLLTEILRISPIEARRRVSAAEALAPRHSMLGEVRPAQYPRLGDLARTGGPSTEVVTIAVQCLTRLKVKFFANPAELDWAEEQLCASAAQLGPVEFRQVAATITDVLFPDGLLDDEQVHDARDLTLTRLDDGSYRVEGRLTGTCGAMWSAILSPLSAPRPEDPSGKDHRTAGQRRHDGLAEAARRLLNAGGLPDSGGTPCTVVAVTSIQDLLNRTGHATTSDGQRISITELLKIADQAELLPTILTKSGTPLTMGRSLRTATKYQTMALYARDGGCSFPGCDHPPEWCDRHHIVYWRDGGKTDINNLTLLCDYHHDKFETKGWTCQLNTGGLPEWVPPKWIDPDQKPLINTRITQRILTLLPPNGPG